MTCCPDSNHKDHEIEYIDIDNGIIAYDNDVCECECNDCEGTCCNWHYETRNNRKLFHDQRGKVPMPL